MGFPDLCLPQSKLSKTPVQVQVISMIHDIHGPARPAFFGWPAHFWLEALPPCRPGIIRWSPPRTSVAPVRAPAPPTLSPQWRRRHKPSPAPWRLGHLPASQMLAGEKHNMGGSWCNMGGSFCWFFDGFMESMGFNRCYVMLCIVFFGMKIPQGACRATLAAFKMCIDSCTVL